MRVNRMISIAFGGGEQALRRRACALRHGGHGGNNQGRADDGPCIVGYRMPSAAPALP
jgi:hypothetical protein